MSEHNQNFSFGEGQDAQLRAMRKVLERRQQSLDALLLDIKTSQSNKQLFEQITLVVDWSEVHAYVCGSGLSRQDPLFTLFQADDSSEAGRIKSSLLDGAHQSALSFLFEVFPGTAIVLPPHVIELVAFVKNAGLYIDMREVDDDWLKNLHSQIMSQSEAIRTLKQVYDELVNQGDFPSKNATVEDIREILFAKLSEKHANEIQDWIRRIFSPMFLLGRWISVNAYKDLLDLMRCEDRPPRLRFLEDHENTKSFSKKLCEEIRDIGFWKEELPHIPDKSPRLVENDARAMAFLQGLNVRLSEQGRQLLFVSRGQDINGVLSKYPEWFSCMSDEYFSEYDEIEGWKEVGDAPLISRSWHYFLELGAVCDLAVNDQLTILNRPNENWQILLEDRREQIKSILSSLPEKQQHSQDVREKIASYISKEEAWLEKNVQALCSARSAQFRNRPNRKSNISSLIGAEPLIAFLSYITDPDLFRQERQKLLDELAPVLVELNKVLPPIQASEPSDVFKPILHHVLEKIDCQDMFFTSISNESLRKLLTGLLEAIKNGHQIHQVPDLIKGLREFRQTAIGQPEKEREAGNDSPVGRLIFSLHAYSCNQFKKARLLLPERLIRQLPGLSKVVGWLLIADCWLLGEHKLWKADSNMEEALKSFSERNEPILRIVLVNACLGMELDASDEHDGENPDGFRISFEHHVLAEHGANLNEFRQPTRIQDRLEQLEKLVSSVKIKLPDELNISVMNNRLYAVSRLSFPKELEDADLVGIDKVDDPVVLNERMTRLANDLEELIPILQSKSIETIFLLDTLSYYYYKVATLPSSSQNQNRRQKARQAAISHSNTAMETLEEKRKNNQPCSRAARALEAHRFLLDRMEWAAQNYDAN
jgi:hypothetical protein